MSDGHKRDPRTDVSIRDIAERIRFARREDVALGRTVFLIGAGCSVSAGIPSAAQVARSELGHIVDRLGLPAGSDAAANYDALRRDNRIADCLRPNVTAGGSSPSSEDDIDWHRVYDQIFERYYNEPDDIRECFDRIVEDAGSAMNWAHLCLGEIVSKKWVSTVITTNFDQLVLAGMVRAGVIPVVCDGVESLNRISGQPRHPQLIELHGSRHTYRLRNTPADVAAVATDHQAIGKLQSLMQATGAFIVVGYGGREDGVMDLLIQAARAHPDKHLFWVAHDTQIDRLAPKVRDFLATDRNGRLLLGQDADTFFLELSTEIGTGAPSVIARPLDLLDPWLSSAERAAHVNADIKAELGDARTLLKALLDCRDRHLGRSTSDRLAARVREARLAGRIAEAKALIDETFPADEDLTQLSHTELLREGYLTLYSYGQVTGDRPSVERAVSLAQSRIGRIRREVEPDAWAAAMVDLGTALQTLGERGTARLEEAVAAFRDALLERTRERVPLRWAGTQSSLGNALATLGERESNPARLREALDCVRLAREVFIDDGGQIHLTDDFDRRIASIEAAIGARSAGN